MTPITLLLAIFFTVASSIKILAWQRHIFATQLAFFKKYGLNRMAMLMVGLIELSAALLLFGSVYLTDLELNRMGALILAITSIGALYFHYRYDPLKDAIAALITLILSSVLLLANGTVSEFLGYF